MKIPLEFSYKKSFKISVDLIFDINRETEVKLKYPNFNFLLKELVFLKRKKEFFFKMEFFKLILICHSNYYFRKDFLFSF